MKYRYILGIKLKQVHQYLLVPTKDGREPKLDITNSSVWNKNQAVKQGHVMYCSIKEFIYADLVSV
ncbi:MULTISPECIES: hypothetical protein [Bacillus]|uniref:hypothetical protein n=1 Tax=Bacillus TaxID=1386 RepID=UPI001327F785|nr:MULTISPECIES: hypothetical protein [Bacillus]MCY7690981.1 hypothetical protein [Bacillus altitudinis]MDN4636042.1 hypothetical protein [Bacillus sp. PsM16]MXP81521.1 hypothetical protein [Bacillus sp. AN2]